MMYVIFQNDDKTEAGMCERAAFSLHQEDTNGVLMHVMKEFLAPSWEEASKIYKEFFGHVQ